MSRTGTQRRFIVKKALVLSLFVMLGLAFASAVAWAGPTIGGMYLDYDEDVAGSEGLLPAFGISYVHEFGSSWGAFENFLLTDLVIHMGDPWEFAFAGYLDLQATYDFTLYAVEDTPVFVIRPGAGFILPINFAAAPSLFVFGIDDPGVAVSAALVVPYVTIRGEIFYSAKGFGWAAGASIDYFDIAALFRTNKDTTEASK